MTMRSAKMNTLSTVAMTNFDTAWSSHGDGVIEHQLLRASTGLIEHSLFEEEPV
ncbi:hypothetical protein FQN53_004432 [Emmonsiellopsis sp. PD_33]|nr:hypothetical protein FQN53_004432 [Emmonsiellopsis sp. PD_33]